MKKVIEASKAIAIGAKLCRPEVLPIYPITPQTHIVEELASMVADGELNAEIIHAESEHSAISAGVGASAAGARTFTATSSQGLALMNEILHITSGMRLPIVMAVANRSLSAPINIWNDHQDSMSARDTGWIQLYAESSQEALDTTIQAFKIAEHKDVQLPVMVCIDGFQLSHVFEPADIPTQEEVDKFVPAHRQEFRLDTAKPITFGPIAFPDTFMRFKEDQQKATLESSAIIKQTNKEFAGQFKRSYGDGLIELYKMEKADTAIMCIGTIAGTTRTVIDELRKKGQKVGLIRIRCFRPFPAEEISKAVSGLKTLIILDRAVSYGNQGPLYTEVSAAINELRAKNKKSVTIKGYIVGLGGQDVTPEVIKQAVNCADKKGTEWIYHSA